MNQSEVALSTGITIASAIRNAMKFLSRFKIGGREEKQSVGNIIAKNITLDAKVMIFW